MKSAAEPESPTLRTCLRDPIPELAEAALALSEAVDAHAKGDGQSAARLIAGCNTPAIREWVESLWGANSPSVKVRAFAGGQVAVPVGQRAKARMPSSAELRALHERDGYHCRFCGIPVIRKEVRVRIQKAYPEALPWGRKNLEQHGAFQAMWAQYDHLLPHTRGGTNDLDNVGSPARRATSAEWSTRSRKSGSSTLGRASLIARQDGMGWSGSDDRVGQSGIRRQPTTRRAAHRRPVSDPPPSGGSPSDGVSLRCAGALG